MNGGIGVCEAEIETSGVCAATCVPICMQNLLPQCARFVVTPNNDRGCEGCLFQELNTNCNFVLRPPSDEGCNDGNECTVDSCNTNSSFPQCINDGVAANGNSCNGGAGTCNNGACEANSRVFKSVRNEETVLTTSD